MSAAYALRELPCADLEAIWVYTVEQWGGEQAERHLKSLFTCRNALAENPQLGRQSDEVKAGYRSFPQGRHAVFYVVAPAGIEVIGIVHQSADVDRHLGQPPLSDQTGRHQRASHTVPGRLAQLGGSEPQRESAHRRKTMRRAEAWNCPINGKWLRSIFHWNNFAPLRFQLRFASSTGTGRARQQ